MLREQQFEIWRHTPLILSAFGQTVFILFYSLRPLGAGQWWKDPIGRALFIKSSTLGILLNSLLLAYVARWIQGEYSGVTWHVTKYDGNLEYWILFGYWAVCFGVYFQMAALLRQRFSSRKSKLTLRFEP